MMCPHFQIQLFWFGTTVRRFLFVLFDSWVPTSIHKQLRLIVDLLNQTLR